MNIFSVAMRDQHAQPELSNIQKPHITLQSSDGPICFVAWVVFSLAFLEMSQSSRTPNTDCYCVV